MIDRNLLVNEFEGLKSKLGRKGVRAEDLDQARQALLARRTIAGEVDEIKAEVNTLSSQIGKLMRGGQKAEAETLKAKVHEVKEQLASKEDKLREVDESLQSLLMNLPNIPDDRAPEGSCDEDNIVIRHEGYDAANYQGKTYRPHWEIAEELGLLDTKRAAKISGSMFAILKGDGARLMRALVQLGLDLNRERYEEMVVPHLVRTSTLLATGHLPKFAEDAFKIPEDDLWAIPTGEVPLTGYHADEILAAEELPKRYMTYTACFRREAGSAGKETRGLQRLHEFHKLELLHIVAPEEGDQAFLDLLADAERPLKALGLPYRILDLCAGDLTFSSARMHDIEVYSPGTQSWLECSSVGLFTDYQSRRCRLRYRPSPKAKPEPCYTLNGSGVATPRLMAALLEHYYIDGALHLPECLHDYMGKKVIASGAHTA